MRYRLLFHPARVLPDLGHELTLVTNIYEIFVDVTTAWKSAGSSKSRVKCLTLLDPRFDTSKESQKLAKFVAEYSDTVQASRRTSLPTPIVSLE